MKLGVQGPVIRLLEAIGFHSVWVVFLHGYEKVIIPWYRLGALFPNAPALAAAICFFARWAVIYGMFRFISRLPHLRRRKRTRTPIILEP